MESDSTTATPDKIERHPVKRFFLLMVPLNAALAEVTVESSSPRELVVYIAGTLACALGLGYFMSHVLHAAFPYWDATVASASIIAQLMLTWRRIENWLWWIGANMISIVIYPLKGLYLTAALYAFMMSLSILGFRAWRKKLRAQRRAAIHTGA